jgi:hypothetical protein
MLEAAVLQFASEDEFDGQIHPQEIGGLTEG